MPPHHVTSRSLSKSLTHSATSSTLPNHHRIVFKRRHIRVKSPENRTAASQHATTPKHNAQLSKTKNSWTAIAYGTTTQDAHVIAGQLFERIVFGARRKTDGSVRIVQRIFSIPSGSFYLSLDRQCRGLSPVSRRNAECLWMSDAGCRRWSTAWWVKEVETRRGTARGKQRRTAESGMKTSQAKFAWCRGWDFQSVTEHVERETVATVYRCSFWR